MRPSTRRPRATRRRRLRRAIAAALAVPGLLLLTPRVAGAAERDAEAEALAQEAQGAVDRYCSEAVSDDVTLAAESVAAVSAVWAKVSAKLEESRKVYLLYWRGVLGQCLDQEEKALADLHAFLGIRGGSDEWASLVADAQRRVRQLERKTGRGKGRVAPRPSAGPVAAGVGSGVAAGALGGLAGWQWSETLATRQALYDGEHVGGDLQTYLDDERRTKQTTQGLAVGAGVAGAASAGLMAVGAALDRRATSVVVVPWLDVGPAGSVGVVLAGGW